MIPLGEAAFCPDCSVLFNVRELKCPVCDGDSFYLIAKMPSVKIAPADTGAGGEINGTGQQDTRD